MSKFKVGDKVRAVANPTSKYYSNAGYFNAGEEFTVEEVFPWQNTVKLVEDDGGWSEKRFELVEPVSAATLTTLVVPQLPGIPEGYRAVRIGTPVKGEWYIDPEGDVVQSSGRQMAGGYVILEKIDQPAPVEPVKPEAPVAPTFKVGDKVRLVDNTSHEKFPIGTVATVRRKTMNSIPSEGELLLFDGALEAANGMFAYRFELAEEAKPAQPKFKKGDKIKCVKEVGGCTMGNVYTLLNDFDSGKRLVFKDDDGDVRRRSVDPTYVEFEIVNESPYDLVIQDRVPAREGIDFGWWVDTKDFDQFVPHISKVWKVNSSRAGLMHGYVEDADIRLAVMCYRRVLPELPELPTTEKVRFLEYICWDNESPEARVLKWQTEGMVHYENYTPYDNECPTGNTREIEVPIVKP